MKDVVGMMITQTLVGMLIILFWVVNLLFLFKCDFEPSYKEEIIHIVGVLLPPASIITVWF